MRLWLAIGILAGVVCAQGGTDIKLAKVGTAGRIPSKLSRLTIQVSADGGLLVAGKARDVVGLERHLRVAEAAIIPNVYIRADRDLPWQATQWLMIACARAKRSRLFFAVNHEQDGKEGAFALFLPTDTPRGYDRRKSPVRVVKIELDAKGAPTDPARLYGLLHAAYAKLKRKEREAVHIDIVAAPETATGDVLKVCDAIVRAGIRRIFFAGTTLPKKGEDYRDLIAKLRKKRRPGGPRIVVGGGPAQSDVKSMPPVKRNESDLAGSTLPRLVEVAEEETPIDEKTVPAKPKDPLPERVPSHDVIEKTHARSLAWLVGQQQQDGGWKGGGGPRRRRSSP